MGPGESWLRDGWSKGIPGSRNNLLLNGEQPERLPTRVR